jgi:hypothetical protein
MQHLAAHCMLFGARQSWIARPSYLLVGRVHSVRLLAARECSSLVEARVVPCIAGTVAAAAIDFLVSLGIHAPLIQYVMPYKQNSGQALVVAVTSLRAA